MSTKTKLLTAAVLFGALRVLGADPGWTVDYFADPAFFTPGGTVSVKTPELKVDINRLKYPKNNWDAEKGPLANGEIATPPHTGLP